MLLSYSKVMPVFERRYLTKKFHPNSDRDLIFKGLRPFPLAECTVIFGKSSFKPLKIRSLAMNEIDIVLKRLAWPEIGQTMYLHSFTIFMNTLLNVTKLLEYWFLPYRMIHCKKNNRSLLEHETPHTYIHQKAHAYHCWDYRWPPITEHHKRYPYNRQQSYGHTHIDDQLPEDYGNYAYCHNGA